MKGSYSMGFMRRLREKFVKTEEKETKKYKEGMDKTRTTFTDRINDLFARYRSVDEDFFEELEEVLISADVGVMTVLDLIDLLKMEVKRLNIKDPKNMTEVIYEKLVEIYYGEDDEVIEKLQFAKNDDLTVILVVGVNGVGKTTSIGKLAYKLKKEGKDVL